MESTLLLQGMMAIVAAMIVVGYLVIAHDPA